MDYVNKRLSETEAKGIADELLKAFGILYNAIPMKLTSSIQGGRETITRVFYDSENPEKTRIEEGFVDYNDSDEWHLDNVYELFWKRQKFEMTLYSSPEECGYYSILPEKLQKAYLFCIIKNQKRPGGSHSEMCFGFDSKKKIFLELFDIDFYPSKGEPFSGALFSAEDSIEYKLKGIIIC